MSKRKGMSKEMYQFILDNKDKLSYDLDKGIVITPMKTNGTVCTSTGYLRVKVNKKTLQVHQILSVIYFGEINIGMTVNHKDGNKLNNKKENLEVISLELNIKDGFKTGIYDSLYKKIEMSDINGNSIMCFYKMSDICRYFNVKNSSNITRALKNNKLTAYGFKWKEL